MAYRVIIECDTAEEAQAVQRHLQRSQPQVIDRLREQEPYCYGCQVKDDRLPRPLREPWEPYCYGCESHGCICKRITTGYMVG